MSHATVAPYTGGGGGGGGDAVTTRHTFVPVIPDGWILDTSVPEASYGFYSRTGDLIDFFIKLTVTPDGGEQLTVELPVSPFKPAGVDPVYLSKNIGVFMQSGNVNSAAAKSLVGRISFFYDNVRVSYLEAADASYALNSASVTGTQVLIISGTYTANPLAEPEGILLASAHWPESGLTPESLPGHDGAFWFQYGGRNSIETDCFRTSFPDTQPEGYENSGISAFVTDENLQEVYIRIRARIGGADPRGACKFCKVFGSNAGVGYHNASFQLESNGSYGRILFADGTTESGDAAQVLNYDRSYPEYTGRNYELSITDENLEEVMPMGAAYVFPPSTSEFSVIDIIFKFNSGETEETEINDGRFYVAINGNVYCDAQNIFNRHWSNSLYIDQIGFVGVVQNSPAFNVDIRSIEISKNGFMS